MYIEQFANSTKVVFQRIWYHKITIIILARWRITFLVNIYNIFDSPTGKNLSIFTILPSNK